MASALPQTRSRAQNYLLGTPISSEEEDKFMLQSYGTLLRRFMYEVQDERLTTSVVNEKVEIIYSELQIRWRQGGIKTLEDKSIKNKLKKCFLEDLDTAKNQKSKREEKTPQNQKWIEEYRKKRGFDELFNVSKCQCFRNARSTLEIMSGSIKCSCDEPIPQKELKFFAHQIFERGKSTCLIIGRVDPEAIRQQILEEERLRKKMEESLRLERQRQRESSSSVRHPFTNEDVIQLQQSATGGGDIEEEFSDDDFGDGYKTKKYCKVPYRRNALGALRYGDSTRSVRAQINWTVAELLDYGAFNRHYTENIQELLISVDAFRDRQERYGKELISAHSQTSKRFVCLKFDGKRTKTLLKNSKSEIQEHIVVISEPGSRYLDHFVPSSGKGVQIANEMHSHVIEYDSVDTLLAVGADGTAANTGLKLGAIRQLELKLEFPLQW